LAEEADFEIGHFRNFLTGQMDSETGFIMMTQRTQILLTTRIKSTTTPLQHRIYNFPT